MVLLQWSLTYWRRFRDDIFAITSSFSSFQTRFQLASLSCSTRGVTSSWQEDVSQNKITFLAVAVFVVHGCFVTKPREKVLLPLSAVSTVAHPRDVHISWPVVLRKALDQFVSIEKEQCAAVK